MVIKIRSSTFVDNGTQRIHILGYISPMTFARYYSRYNEPLYHGQDIYERDRNSHYAIQKFIKDEISELGLWMLHNKAQATCWIDSGVFNYHPSITQKIFPYGIGFRPNDPLENWFVLRWS